MFGQRQNNEAAAPAADPEAERWKAGTPVMLGEISAVVLGLLAVLFAVAAAGLWKVEAPAEKDLCTVKALQLQNKTHSEKDLALGSCHTLYATVFYAAKGLSVPFIACGALAGISCYTTGVGARTREADRMRLCFRWSGLFALIGVVVLWVPSGFFFTLSLSLTALMAPITALWLGVYAAYYGSKVAVAVSNSTQAKDMQYYSTVVYKAYMACWYADTCLFLGSIAMIVLWAYCIYDFVRAVGSVMCWTPRYELLEDGWETLFRCRQCKRKPEAME